MFHPTLSFRNITAVLALIVPLTQAHASDLYQYKIYAPGLVAEVPPSGGEPPPPARNYATLRTGTASFVLSGDGLTATHTGYQKHGNVLANVGLSSGKWYWEVRRQPGTRYVAIGIAAGHAYEGYAWGDNPYSTHWGIAYGNYFGFSYYAANIKNVPMPSGEGDLLGFALDMDTGTLYIYNNCVEYGIWNGWSGVRYPAIGSGGGAAGGVVVANFGASPFGCPVPPGFNAGVWAD